MASFDLDKKYCIKLLTLTQLYLRPFSHINLETNIPYTFQLINLDTNVPFDLSVTLTLTQMYLFTFQSHQP
jgi:hypothetical protein